MSLSILSNIDSLRAQRQLSSASAQLSQTFERLSSGLRINNASDDPAGLIIADRLKADGRIATQAIRNANDGISLLSIADGSLEEIGNILTRMAELAENSANGTQTAAQRTALQAEFAALGSEVTRIARTTEFNDLTLLSNSNSVSLQVGLDGEATSQISFDGVEASLNALGLGTAGETLSYSIIGAGTAGSQAAAVTALDAIQAAINVVSTRRGTVGAVESRLTFAVNNLQILRENISTAESQIRDADIAEEAAKLVRLQILRDASAAVLAQANQQPQIALQLLG